MEQSVTSPASDVSDAVPLIPKGAAAESGSSPSTQRASDGSPKSLLRQRLVVLPILAYGVLGMVYLMLDELFPLFAKTAYDDGGISFSSAEIGISVMSSGVRWA